MNQYELALNQSTKIVGDGIDIEITRVPGGWIYNLITKSGENWYSNVVFVPLNNEFRL